MRLVDTGQSCCRSIVVCVLAVTVLAVNPWVTAAAASTDNPAPFLMADDTGGNQGSGGGSGQGNQQQPSPGQLIVPGAPQQGQEDQNKKGKNCVTVCAQWGQECMLVNQGAGGLQRRCRHVCKQFTEECY